MCAYAYSMYARSIATLPGGLLLVPSFRDTEYTHEPIVHTSTVVHIGGGMKSSKSLGTDCFSVFLVVSAAL
jgi:hypothetical protein